MMAAYLDAQDAEARVGAVEGHALNQAGERLAFLLCVGHAHAPLLRATIATSKRKSGVALP
jgi:hypothetical protein